MAPLTEAQRRALEDLRVSYESELPDKLGQIVRVAAALEAGGYDRARVQYLHEHAHQLAGSAGVYGYHALSRCAAALEILTGAALKGAKPLSADDRLAFLRRLHTLWRALASAPRPAGGARGGIAGTGSTRAFKGRIAARRGSHHHS